MSDLIHTLYYGEIVPFEKIQGTVACKACAKHLKIMEDAQEKLMNSLNDSDKMLFCEYVDAINTVSATENVESFSHGFALGTNLVVDSIAKNITAKYSD